METWVVILSILFYIFSMVSLVQFFKRESHDGVLDRGTEYMVNFIFWFTLSVIGFVIVLTG